MEKPENEDLTIEELEYLLEQKKKERADRQVEGYRRKREEEFGRLLRNVGGDLSMEAHFGERAGERVSIYKDGKYIGDVYSDDNLRGFRANEFQDKVYALAYSTGVENLGKPRIKLNIGEGAEDVMQRCGVLVQEGGENLLLRYHERGRKGARYRSMESRRKRSNRDRKD